MGTERDRKSQGVSRQAEEGYLGETLAVVRGNVENYGREVARMQENIDEMLAHYHDDNVEVLTILNNTVTMHAHMKRALSRNEKALNKPYFGRIIFRDKALGKEESLYIGRGGISKDATHWMVVDWRAPVANAYYENSLGRCSYTAPGGVEMEIDLRLKRTYEIEDGKLLDYFDSEVIANDDLLTKYLAKTKQAVLGEIVATIQKEQNEIIRKSPYHNLIVQGVAGSGKTTVAMHRISFILYNYEERFRPDDFYIVGSNRILLNYITGVLPDLDVYGVRQMTMEQLFIRLLYEDWEEKKYHVRSTDKSTGKGSVKGGSRWFRDLEKYCQRLEWEVIPRETVVLDPRQFVEGFRNGKTGVFDRRDGKAADPKTLVRLLERERVEEYILQNPTVSVQGKIDMLNKRLMEKIREEFLGKGIKYSEVEKKAIRKAYRGYFGGRVWKRPVFEMYRDFLLGQRARGHQVEIPENEFDVYDLAALAYLYKRIKEQEVISEAHHIVIDEAQDFGMMAYHVLKFCIYGCTYTVMGDVSQNIHFGFGLNDWEELKELLLPDSMDSFGILKKSYRNTVEISDFATSILHHGQFSSYPVEPIIRHGNPVQVRKLDGRKELIQEAAKTLKGWQRAGLDTIALICRDQESALAAAAELSEYVEIMESDLEKAEFGNGIMALPVAYTKGLEFDAVLVLNPTREEYPVDDGHAKLLYVAATRALHELCVLHQGDLTGLIADPLPEKTDMAKGRRVPARGREPGVARRGEPGRVGKPGTARREEIGKGKPEAARREEPARGRKPGFAGSREEISKKENLPVRAMESAGTMKTAPGIVGGRNRPSAVSRKVVTPEDKKPFIIKPIRPLSWQEQKPKDGLGPEGGQGGRQTEKASSREVRRNRHGDGRGFGDMPPTEILRPPGHGKIDLAVRWFMSQPDGFYLQSRYGTLRLSPVQGNIIRVTFAKGSRIPEGVHPGIALSRTDRAWMYKESGGKVELITDQLCLQADKAGGAVSYMARDKKLLLAERQGGCRQIEDAGRDMVKGWLYLDWQKKENVYGLGAVGKEGLNLRGGARYISQGAGGDALPFVLSDKGYGIVLAADAAICCDIPAYGTYLYIENKDCMDFYFITGKNQNEILKAYGKLCGK